MQVDRGGFLLFVSSLALGSGVGYIASERDLVPHLDRRPPPAPPAASVTAEPRIDAGPPVISSAVVDAGPVCDDAIGEPVGTCPPVGFPTVEGGCGPYAANRCNDFKRTMKPRVATAAVECLNKLTGAERCDPKRVELCGHLALMNACPDPAGTTASHCDAIADACKSAPVTPSKAECSRTMSGLREIGRETLLDCTKKHCFDKGILGCEAAVPAKP